MNTKWLNITFYVKSTLISSKKNVNSAFVGFIAVSIGISIIISSMLFYPLFLPKIITSANSDWIQQTSYIFYMLLLISFILSIFGIYKFSKFLKSKYSFDNDNLSIESVEDSTTMLNISSKNETLMTTTTTTTNLSSIFRIILNIVSNRKYFRFFWPTAIGYGIIYAIISGIIIIRPDGGLAHVYGIHDLPSIVMMQYGPVGYVPTMSIYFTDSIGIFIIPLNLIVILVVSTLVGFNSVISIYAFSNFHSRKRLSFTNTASSSSFSFMGALGATTSLFITCPTCASFYIFSAIAGGLAPSIAAFTVTYYTLFLMISIPLLLCTPLITALSISKKMEIKNNAIGQCSLNKKNN